MARKNDPSEFPRCRGVRRACLAYSGGKCLALLDCNFGTKRCPFYKTKAMLRAQVGDKALKMMEVSTI